MSLPGAAELLAALDATWPAHSMEVQDGWLLRDGAGGGKRVSAATRDRPGALVAHAENWMRARGERPLFRMGPGDEDLDAALAGLGYAVLDPSLIYAAPASALAQKPPPVSLFDIWPPLAIMREIWAAGGIGDARLAVMARAPQPRTGLIARRDDRAVGVGFVAVQAQIAMLHAVEVVPGMRRRGIGALILGGAAHWAQAQGASWMALAVTEANTGAAALYKRAGMAAACGYHYREAPR
ncbi:MAG: GNAT family N-acetyltransferase [Rhodobacteraceae bacterium]|nr:GNAT family N-acetyltransferase [Paracoccaceae bacterium]TVR49413.1 MAG: GNAT family N-acetyltransferase [Paracoccaceae bacterium]